MYGTGIVFVARCCLVGLTLFHALVGCSVYDTGHIEPHDERPTAGVGGGANADAMPAQPMPGSDAGADARTADAAAMPDATPPPGDAASGDAGSTTDAGCTAGSASPVCAPVCQQDCLPEASCTRREYAGAEYFFCTNSLTWAEARARCRSRPAGDLLRIDDDAEAAFVDAALARDSWLSGEDTAREGLWRWADNGVPFWQGLAAGSAVLDGYARWASGQPDSASAEEDCAKLATDGSWSDQDCGNVAAFVCETGPDRCPADEAKTDPGQCGCGELDADADEDGFAACHDACPDDGDKLAPGACGCGVADGNRDGDAAPDCDDACPDDASKLVAGGCGCGVADSNADGDAELDCNDLCAADPGKLAPGQCGCGNAETDGDGDGSADCVDACPGNPLGSVAASGCGLGFAPANVQLAQLQPQNAAATTMIDCAAELDTSGTPSFTTWCSGTRPPIAVQSQTNGPELAVVTMRALDLRAAGRLTIRGTRPAVLLVFGDATVAGVIDASASGSTAGGGGDDAGCGSSRGESVTTCAAGSDETGGGGGGGFGTAGGRGGDGDDCSGGDGGVTRGLPSLVPLLGGCPGGAAGACSGRGAGGGAFQLSVGGTLTLSGSLRANGGAGPARCSGTYIGAGGGGSGGAIRVEALGLVTTGSSVQVNGGKGGNTTASSGTGTGGDGSISASNPGADASNATPNPQPDLFGGGGGGGGFGRVVLCNRTTGSGCQGSTLP